MLTKGMLLRVQTKTKDDVFGDCLYEVQEVGMTFDNPGGGGQKVTDGVRVVMLGGSGPAARGGITLHDTESKILSDIATGITEIVSAEKRAGIMEFYGDRAKDGTPRRAATGATGVVDLD